MVTTTFVDETTVIEPAWCNDVDALTYEGTLTPTILTVGVDGSNSSIDGASDTSKLTIASTLTQGGGLTLYGDSHATLASDWYLTSVGAATTISWDESAGELDFYTKVGVSKTLALNINAVQVATFTDDLIVDGTTDSTSGTTGSIQTDGGIGAVKDIATDANVVIATAGKGVDFSANTAAAGMASELLDWIGGSASSLTMLSMKALTLSRWTSTASDGWPAASSIVSMSRRSLATFISVATTSDVFVWT